MKNCVLFICSTFLAACSLGIKLPPPRTQPVVSQCPADSVENQAIDTEFGQRLIRQVSSNAFYPQEAFNAGISGVISICAKVDDRGVIVAGLIRKSSGSLLLDGAALYAVGKAQVTGPLQSLPPQVATDGAWFEFPISFAAPQPKAAPGGAAPDADAPPPADCTSPSISDDDGKPLKADDPVESTKEATEYLARISQTIGQKLAYPADLAQSHIEGKARAGLCLNRSGRIIGGAIQSSSGDPLFDGALLMALGQIALTVNFGPPPVSAHAEYFRLAVLVNWTL